MPRDDDQSLGDQQTYEGGAQPADSSDRSLGDQSTFGGGGESSLSDIGGLTGDADLDMEIVDLSRYEVQETLGKGGMGEVLLATDTRLNRKVAIKRMLGDEAKSQTAVKVADVIEKAHSLRGECRFKAASNATLQVVCR